MSRVEGLIIKALSGYYYVETADGVVTCRARGKFRLDGTSPLVGDRVALELTGDGGGSVREILPRRTVFCRPDRGGHADGFARTLRVQPLVANMNYVFIITSLSHDFSLGRIARYASIAVSGGAMPVAVLTIADLCPNPAEMEEKVASI